MSVPVLCIEVPDADVAELRPDVGRIDGRKRVAGVRREVGGELRIFVLDRRNGDPDDRFAGRVPGRDLVVEVVAVGVRETERRIGVLFRKTDVVVVETADVRRRKMDGNREILDGRSAAGIAGRGELGVFAEPGRVESVGPCGQGERGEREEGGGGVSSWGRLQGMFVV